MRQTFKKTFQLLEIWLKKALGIRKVKKGHIFDTCEKITRFVLFLPLFQKIRTLVSVSEFSNGIPMQIATYGGGGKSTILNPHSAR